LINVKDQLDEIQWQQGKLSLASNFGNQIYTLIYSFRLFQSNSIKIHIFINSDGYGAGLCLKVKFVVCVPSVLKYLQVAFYFYSAIIAGTQHY